MGCRLSHYCNFVFKKLSQKNINVGFWKLYTCQSKTIVFNIKLRLLLSHYINHVYDDSLGKMSTPLILSLINNKSP